MVWDATGGCWRQSFPCSDLCAAVGYCGEAPGAVSACCTWHMCWLYVCMVVLDRHLVICVGYMFACAVLVFTACYCGYM